MRRAPDLRHAFCVCDTTAEITFCAVLQLGVFLSAKILPPLGRPMSIWPTTGIGILSNLKEGQCLIIMGFDPTMNFMNTVMWDGNPLRCCPPFGPFLQNH